MGKRGSQRRSAALFDSDDDDSVSSSSTAMSDLTLAPENEDVQHDTSKSLDLYLDALYEKRGSTREKALSLIIEAFKNNLQHEFAEKKYVTLLHQCLNSIKRGSGKEISLASQAIGLLALTTGCGDNARELLEESVTPLSQALKSGSEMSKISSVRMTLKTILDCLAVVTFVGGNDPEETERAMQIMWQFIHPKSGSNVVARKLSPDLITAATSSWSFLLTTIDGWRLNSKSWQESISYFSSLLDKDDRSVRIAAGEALALILEIASPEKFSGEAKGSSDDSVSEVGNSREGYAYIQGLKGKILNQVRNLSMEAGGKGSAKKELSSQRNLFRDVLEFLEGGYCPKTLTKIGGDSLSTSTWAELIQLNFMKRFLGGGFVKHMQENELLHDVFEFTPRREHFSGNQQKISSTEKRMYKSPNSALNKARTQLLNKQRFLSQGRNLGHFSVGDGSEEV